MDFAGISSNDAYEFHNVDNNNSHNATIKHNTNTIKNQTTITLLGGDQERRAATQFIQEAFPKAKVTAAFHRVYPNTVVINVGTEKQHAHLITVKQRDLYSKYGHPAKGAIAKALKGLK